MNEKDLTPEQRVILKKTQDEWTGIGTSTEPMDHAQARAAIENMYEVADLQKPVVVFCSSPFAANRAIEIWPVVSKTMSDLLWHHRDTKGVDEMERIFSALRPEIVGLLANYHSCQQNGVDFDTNRIVEALGEFANEVSLDILLDIANDESTKAAPSGNYLWGCHDSYWIAYYRFMEAIGEKYDEDHTRRVDAFDRIARNMLWWWPFEKTVFISDRPAELHWFEDELHNEEGPAIRFRDGWSIYAINGHRISGFIIENPEEITPEKVREESNAETRRIMVERYPGGTGKFLADIGAEVLDVDQVNTDLGNPDSPALMRALIRAENDLYLVGTDGSTQRTYYMSLDSQLDIKTCVEAHESIMPFGLKENKIQAQG